MITPTTVIFDCDGVILQSNQLKSDAFAQVLEDCDPALVAEFVAWHKTTGGISRFYKFAHFYREMLAVEDWRTRTEVACDTFGDIVSCGLRSCASVPGLNDLLVLLRARGIPLAVNTGGAQSEIRAVFADRGIASHFRTILGSPATKHENMVTLDGLGLIRPGSVYIGDAALDFELAQDFRMRFVYVAYESEWKNGAEVTRAAGGMVVQDLTALLPCGTHPL